MRPTKPGPWTVNPADIEPRFLSLWEQLDFACPLFYTTTNVVGAGGNTLQTGMSWTPTPLGVGLHHDGTNSSMPMTGYTPPGDETDAPFAVVEIVNGFDTSSVSKVGTSTFPGSNGWVTKLEQFNDTGKVGFTKVGVVDIASTIDSPTGPALIVYNVNADASVDFYVFHYDTGIWEVDESQTDTSAWTPGGGAMYLLADGGGEAPIVDLILSAIWRRTLTSADRLLLAEDPFGFLRPTARLFGIDRYVHRKLQSLRHLETDADRLVKSLGQKKVAI
jgi:hypothetical protein